MLRRHADAEDFLETAQDWLLAREAEHNLLLGIVGSLVESPSRYDRAVYLATLSDGEGVVGCAFRTPPFKVGVTRLPEEGAELLARDLAKAYDRLPAVLGPPDSARAVGRAWARLRGLGTRDGTPQRIYALDRVRMPTRVARGFMRPATLDDQKLVTRWMAEFIAETTLEGAAPGEIATRLIQRRALAIWEDDGPVAMAGYSGITPNTVRVSYVYTPPAGRGAWIRDGAGRPSQSISSRDEVPPVRPVHRPGEPYLQSDLHGHRVQAGGRCTGCPVRASRPWGGS